MKNLYALLSLLLITAVAQAQPTRITGMHSTRHNSVSGKYDFVDSVRLEYSIANPYKGGAKEYNAGKRQSDKLYKVSYNSSFGYFTSHEYVYSFDGNWKKLTDLTLIKNNPSSSLDSYYSVEYTYNTAGNLQQTLSKRWTTGGWKNSALAIYQYDANNNLVEIKEDWDTGFGWEKSRRTVYTYDANNNLIYWEYGKWNGNTFSYDGQWGYYYHFNAHNLTDTVVYLMYSGITNSIDSFARMIYEFDSKGHDTFYLGQMYDNINMNWIDYHKKQTFYNTQGGFLYADLHIQNWSTGMWQLNSRDTLTMTQPQTIRSLTKAWSPAQNSFVDSIATDNSYNHNGQLTMTVERRWDKNQNQWIPNFSGDSIIYHYGVVTGIETVNINAPAVSIYPNPATSFLNVKVAMSKKQPYTLMIYDMAGKLMMQQHITDGKEQLHLPVQQLNAGQYILSIKTNESETLMAFVIAQ